MPVETGERLSFRQAAQVMYGVKQPSPEQIERVRLHIENRELAGDHRGTTTVHVAEFLARSATARQRDARRDAPNSGKTAVELDRVYHESLKDFFLAVVFRRKLQGVSVRLQRAVVVCQVLLVGAVIVAALWSARAAFPPMSPERAAVLQWLQENTVKSRIIRWYPPALDEAGRTRMRVEYHYTTELGKGVATDRQFVIAGDKVVGVETDW